MLWALGLLLSLATTSPGVGLEGRRVRRVTFPGVHALDDDDLMGGLETRAPSGWIFKEYTRIDPLVLDVDRRRVEAFYKARGYFDAKVTKVVTTPSGKLADVAFHVDEGEPTRIARVTPPTPGLKVGEVFVHGRYAAAKQKLEDDWIRRGYPHVIVSGEVRVDRARHAADITFAVDPGPMAVYRAITVMGETRVPRESILARVAFKTGDRFDPAALELTQSRLNALGTFGVVRIDWEREGRPRDVDVAIHVTDGLRHDLRLGGGAAADPTRVDVRLRGRYGERTFFDPLLSWALEVRPTYTIFDFGDADRGAAIEGIATLRREDLIVPLLAGEAALAFEFPIYEAWRAYGPAPRLSLERPFWRDRLHLGAGVQGRYLWLREDEPGVLDLLEVESPYRLAFAEQKVALDLRDVPLDAHRGIYAEIALQEGGRPGDYRYLRIQPDLRGYLPIWSRFVLAVRARAGLLRGDSPLTERFFGGGASDHRGFGFRRLSPQALTASGKRIPVGGNAMLAGSLEARLDVFRFKGSWVGLDLFLDAGDVRREAREIALEELHLAAGVGVRYQTPFGPLRADVGFRLNRTEEAPGPGGLANPDPGDLWTGHISFGEAF